MHLSEFDYDLPERLIAQEPLDRRDASRMLIVDRSTRSWTDSEFLSLPSRLQPHDVVVVNNTRVFPARLKGQRKQSGGRVEVFLVREFAPDNWQALIRPGSKLHSGAIVTFGNGRLSAEIIDEPGPELRKVRFYYSGSFESVLAAVGSTPLPPYIKRDFGATPLDAERYQTIYSRQRGAIAAPTAGLHFTPQMLAKVSAVCRLVEITLHVGYGTFEPVRVEDIEQHQVSGEWFEINEEAARMINRSRREGGRVIAVGTTTLRALESALNEEGTIEARSGETNLTIRPGFVFRATNALLTNFHLPRSSLLLLVCALAGKDLILPAYRHAVTSSYRFYSYGDCMLIL